MGGRLMLSWESGIEDDLFPTAAGERTLLKRYRRAYVLRVSVRGYF